MDKLKKNEKEAGKSVRKSKKIVVKYQELWTRLFGHGQEG